MLLSHRSLAKSIAIKFYGIGKNMDSFFYNFLRQHICFPVLIASVLFFTAHVIESREFPSLTSALHNGSIHTHHHLYPYHPDQPDMTIEEEEEEEKKKKKRQKFFCVLCLDVCVRVQMGHCHRRSN